MSLVRDALRALWQTLREDLVTHAFALRPIQPVRKRIRWLPGLRWLPQAAILFLAMVTFLLGTAVSEGTALPFGLLGAAPVLLVLFRPVGAWWLSLLLTFLSAVLLSADSWPWPASAFLAHLTVMTVVALRSRPSAAVGMWLITVLYGTLATEVGGHWDSNVLPMALVSGIVLTVASLVHSWRSAKDEVIAKDVITVAERSKRTQLEERTNIARELHDVVAHHMSVVAIQAEAAPYRVQDPPPELAAAFATIRENAVAALTELRRVLGVIRAEDYEAPDAPQPTLATLDGLLANVREAGLDVEKTVTGAVRELPPGIELSAYRIIQEALSNTLRHAPGAAARVEIGYVLGGLGLRVVNGPPAAEVQPSPGAGQGIAGMRERVAMLGGRMTADVTDEGGFEVAVLLLVEEDT